MTWARSRTVACWFAALALVGGAGTLALGGYFGGKALAYTPAARLSGARRGDLAAVFWSGDMGMWVGFGSDIPDRLAGKGIPAIAVSSPALFGQARGPAYARQALADSLAAAMRRSGASRVAVIGFSFGADVVAASLDGLDPGLRQRIASVVLVGPGRDIHFHANPFGLFYAGPTEADPARAAAALRGLPVTCIFARGEADDSLCHAPALGSARLTEVDDGHMMLAHREEVTRAVIDAVLHPPQVLP